jgi:dihydrofolate reductase
MRRLRYGVAMSLDGYIAGLNGEFDWIPMDPDIDFPAMYAEFDTLLMGRKTFLVTLGVDGDQQELMRGHRLIVVSRTMKAADYEGVEIVSDSLAERLRALKNEEGKDIWLFGGGELFRSLLDLGLVDGVEVAIIPVVLGKGIPFVAPPATQTSLTLTRTRVYEKTGTVWLQYDVRG